MKKIQQIAFPTDFSEASGKVFQYTLQFAEALGADVHLFYVFNKIDVVPTTTSVIDTQMKEAQRGQVEAQMRDFLQQYTPANNPVQVKTHVLMGGYIQEVIVLFNEWVTPVDVMVMGTAGDFSLSKAIWGSRVAYVVEHSSVPVLVVPEGAVFQPFHKMAYASTFSSEKTQDIADVVGFSQRFSAQLFWVGMRDEQYAHELFSNICPADYQPQWISLPNQQNRLEALNDFCAQEGIDLLFMLSSYRYLLFRFFRYSHAQKMALQTKVPLLVLRG